jgi:hypothetical protein
MQILRWVVFAIFCLILGFIIVYVHDVTDIHNALTDTGEMMRGYVASRLNIDSTDYLYVEVGRNHFAFYASLLVLFFVGYMIARGFRDGSITTLTAILSAAVTATLFMIFIGVLVHNVAGIMATDFDDAYSQSFWTNTLTTLAFWIIAPALYLSLYRLAVAIKLIPVVRPIKWFKNIGVDVSCT